MRGYTVAAAAVSLGISTKTLDNVLIRHEVSGVTRARQGVSRKLTTRAVTILDIAFRLARSLSMPLNHALELAERALNDPAQAIELGKGIVLTFDVQQLSSTLDARLADAVEVTPAPRRGRPPLKA